MLGGGPQQLLLACLDWLDSAPELAAADRERHQARADLDFLRNEKLYDCTQNTNLWFGNLSIVPEIRGRLASHLGKRLYTANLLKQSLTGESLDRCRSLAEEIQQAIDRFQTNYEKVLSEIDDRIRKMEHAELTEDNPFVDAGSVLKRIEAAPERTEAEKAGLVVLVERCSSEGPPHDASQRVALFLHENSITERILPAARLAELTHRWDKAISDHPLSAFDELYTEAKEPDVRRAVDQAAAKVYNRLEAKRDETMAALKALKESYPMGLKHWSALEGFASWANDVDRLKADAGLRLYRAAVEQREKAREAGHFDPKRDVFFAAADFTGGQLIEVPSDEWDEDALEPASTLNGVIRTATADFWLAPEQAGRTYELWILGRQNETAEKLALALNGKTFYEGKVPFGDLESDVARFPVPAKLLTEKKNTLTVNLTANALKMDLNAKDGEPAPNVPPLAIRYAVLKCKAGGKE